MAALHKDGRSVVAGAAIGIASNLVLTRKRENVAVYPTVELRGVGVKIEVRL